MKMKYFRREKQVKRQMKAGEKYLQLLRQTGTMSSYKFMCVSVCAYIHTHTHTHTPKHVPEACLLSWETGL